MNDDIVERLNDMGAALCRGGDAEAGEFLCHSAEEIGRLQAMQVALGERNKWHDEEQERLIAENQQLRAERDAYKGTLRHLAGEGITAARRALEEKWENGRAHSPIDAVVNINLHAEIGRLEAEIARLRAALLAIVEIGTYGTAYQAHNLARRALEGK